MKLEQKYKINLPEIFKEYLMTYSYDFTELLGVVLCFDGELNEQYIELLNIPQENPLKSLQAYIEGICDTAMELYADETLFLSQGYIPFADWGAGWGPLCFDTKKVKIM